MASPFIRIDEKLDQWLTIDLRVHGDDELYFIVVLPGFGPDHRAGMDCWCEPKNDDGVIVHKESH